MTDTNIFTLAQVIKAAGNDPSAVVDAVWAAGYRQPERSDEEAVKLTIDTFYYCESFGMPTDFWPKTYDDVLQNEMMKAVLAEDADHLFDVEPVKAAKSILAAGFSLEHRTTENAGEPEKCRSSENLQVVLVPRELTDDMGEAIAFTVGCCGGIASDIWEAVMAVVPPVGDICLDSVTLPPIMDLEGRSGRDLIIANTHNAAVTMCAMAIAAAGYKTECSPLATTGEASSD